MLTNTEKILFRLFAAESTVYSIPTNLGIEKFLEKLFSTFPGVKKSDICFIDEIKHNQINSDLFGKLVSENIIFNIEDYYKICRQIPDSFVIYPMRTANKFFGFIALEIDREKIKTLLPAINDFAITLSIILENRYQQKLLAQINNEFKKHRKSLQLLVKKRTISLENAKFELSKTLDKTILSLGTAVEYRDPYTAGHHYRVAALAKAIAVKMQLSSKKIHDLYLGALIHDIGKIKIPLEILINPLPLSSVEKKYLEIHPEAGYLIIKHIAFSKIITDIVLHHHERLDGSGYPSHLMNDKIALPTRIVSVADVFEAMSSHRPYRPKKSSKECLSALKKGAGMLYDADVVDVCIELIKKDHYKLPSLSNIALFK